MNRLYFIKNGPNYSDRIIKHTPHQYSELMTYLETYFIGKHKFFDNINFDEADGIDTEITVNWDLNWTPNYLFVTGTDSSDTTGVTCWFVMEWRKIRGRQYRARLHRDVVNDFYEEVIDAPAYIEKATVTTDNPLIFNSEGMLFNQIKKSEDLLKDKTGAYYYIAYIAKNAKRADSQTNDLTITVPNADFDFTTLPSSAEWTELVKGTTAESEYCIDFRKLNEGRMSIHFVYQNSSNPLDLAMREAVVSFTIKNGEVTLANIKTRLVTDFIDHTPFLLAAYKAGASIDVNGLVNRLVELLNDSYETFETMYYNELNHFFTDTDGTKYYKQSVISQAEEVVDQNVYDNLIYEAVQNDRYFKYNPTSLIRKEQSAINGRKISSLGNFVKTKLITAINEYDYIYISYDSQYAYVRAYDVERKRFNRTNITAVSTFDFTIPYNREHTNDAPYDIIVFPNAMTVGKKVGTSTTTVKINESYQRALVDKFNEIGTSEGWLYDMQRVPYSELSTSLADYVVPIQILLSSYLLINSSKSDISDRCVFDATFSTSIKCFAYLQQSKQVTFDIKRRIRVSEAKVSNECDLYRLVSPNGSGMFDFNPAKNGGVAYFNVDCTFRPMVPYIHVNPNFGKLYGQDFNDYRGLVCGGDFSIATTSDRWLQYASQNRFLSQSFDREIQNMDVSYQIQKDSKIFNAVVGSVGAGVAGGMKGAAAGPWGAVAGAVVGTATAAGTAAFNISQGDKAFAETKDFKKDMFDLNLRNIQAQPNTLTKTGSDDYNNKIWVVLEYYTCTDEEKASLRQKLEFNGMTINVIDKISNFIYNDNISYVQAKIIRLDTISEDDHMIMTIRDEISRGVYFKEGD